jgi:hypothetical protein
MFATRESSFEIPPADHIAEAIAYEPMRHDSSTPRGVIECSVDRVVLL